MAERAIRAIRAFLFSQSPPQAFAPLGMRGGLGKTLLIAFLLLAIVPLGLLAFFTYHQIERDSQARLGSLLEDVVALKEGDLIDWFESRERSLALAAVALEEGADSGQVLVQTQALDPSFVGLTLVNLSQWTAIASAGAPATGVEDWRSLGENPGKLAFVQVADSPGQMFPAVGYHWDDQLLLGLLRWETMRGAAGATPGLGEETTTRLVSEDGQVITGEGQVSPRPEAGWPPGFLPGLRGQGVARYLGGDGTPVMGAYLWSPRLGVGVVVEQPQRASAAPADNLTALVIGATLAVALITAASAALVTRRITRPIVQLTETAASMSRGDLDQQVPVVRKDEIGVLARVFNHMAAELRVLYESLEEKVVERTAQLEEANRISRNYIMQLSISAEVARVASSIRELDQLLDTVVALIGRAFELNSVSIYLLDETGRRLVWQAGSAGVAAAERVLDVDGPSLVGHVAADGRRRVLRAADLGQEGPAVPIASEMAVPLSVRGRILGTLHLQSERPGDFGEDDQLVYRSLADQIAIAIENARVYGLERETIHRLRELDEIQAEFLVNMSHALRTPLNSIIGFSRVMLKELDGPLSDLQRADLEAIHDGGRQLLGLINDMLELSQLELGVAPFSASEVNLEEILEGVMATTQALVRNKPVRLTKDVPVPVPSLYTDGQRLRQVILALLSNAAKYTAEGSIRLQVVTTDGAVRISVSDTGTGIPRLERERIFADGPNGDGGDEAGGFGLAISKRVVERLGGEIWVESEEGLGSTFTFTLPCCPATDAPARG